MQEDKDNFDYQGKRRDQVQFSETVTYFSIIGLILIIVIALISQQF